LLIVDGRSPLEHYLLHRPDIYHEDGFQLLPIDLHNVPILHQHMLCAAAEAALRSDGRYPGIPRFADHLQQLADQGRVARRAASPRWIAMENRPHRRLHVRGFERPYVLIEMQTGRRLGRLAAATAFRACFAGAQYVHPGEGMFHVERYDDERCRISAYPTQDRSWTRARVRTSTHDKRLVSACRRDAYDLTYGRLGYTEVIAAFERLAPGTQVRQSVHLLTGHRQDRDTHATWFTFPGAKADDDRQTALHTVVHALLASVPLLCLSDQDDMRAAVYTLSSAGKPGLEAVFVDSHAGGNGLSLDLFQHHTAWLGTALTLLQQCDCTRGCSRCTAPCCDTCQGNDDLNRVAAIDLLQRMLGTVVVPDTPLSQSRSPDGAPRYVYLCLTTQKTADDVGGWQHKRLLGLGVAMTYDTVDRCYRVYTRRHSLPPCRVRTSSLASIHGILTIKFYRLIPPVRCQPFPPALFSMIYNRRLAIE
jgi:DEAD/DEAH box helicase domain-containing protein